MVLKLSYFISNIFFVVSLISVLFVHRSVANAKLQEQVSHSIVKLKRLKFARLMLIIATIMFFIAMSASFIADMKVNG